MIAIELQKLLLKLFQLEVPIVESKRRPAPGTQTRIVYTNDGGFGDPWSGRVYTHAVLLENFVRPDTAKNLIFEHTHCEHDLSGQMDAWFGRVDNILPEEEPLFIALINLAKERLHIGTTLKTDFYINGKSIVL